MLEEIWLVHPDEAMAEAFTRRFAGLPKVRVLRCRFEDLKPHDCFVTAGNAFGIMTAGIDAAVDRSRTGGVPGVPRNLKEESMAEVYVSTDVEADGPIPGPNSMLSFASAAYLTDSGH